MSHRRYQPGTTVAGHYTITATLGTGGTSGVYRARDTLLNRTVAIKIIGDESPTTAPRNFMTEARAAAVLSHPNIVNVYDVLEMGDERYIIMEYVCGITLREYLDHHGHLSVKETVSCAHQVLRALHAAHSRGIVHRDIKPGNILLTPDGRVKVTDFGIARLPDRDSFLMPDRTVGTVHYVSPEQAGGGAVDERSDLYSLGILMYEMLTGRRPFEAERPADVAMMQISTRPDPPSQRNPHIPPALEKIVLCALEKDPAARFDSAAEMLRMLDRLPSDLLEGRARPLREEGSAYRMAAERLDERTLPLPKSWFRRRGGGKPEENAATASAPAAPAPAPTQAPTPAPAPTVTATPIPTRPTAAVPPAPVRRRETAPPPPPPPPTPIGNMLDAFTAQDTMDIMLAPSGSDAPEASSPAAEEPVLFARRPRPDTRATAAPDAAMRGGRAVPPPPPEAAPARKAHRAGHRKGSGENRFFRFFMLIAALLLAILLLVGVVTALREREARIEGEGSGTYLSLAAWDTEGRDAL